MQKLTALTSDSNVQSWLQQFHLGDRSLAKSLIEAFILVSRDDFIGHLRAMLLSEAKDVDGRVALYAERELSAATSPMLANLAMNEMDGWMTRLADRYGRCFSR